MKRVVNDYGVHVRSLTNSHQSYSKASGLPLDITLEEVGKWTEIAEGKNIDLMFPALWFLTRMRRLTMTTGERRFTDDEIKTLTPKITAYDLLIDHSRFWKKVVKVYEKERLQ